MSLIEVKNVFKSYGDKKVLKNVSIEINKGEDTAIIGPNGTGKTTLMELMITLRKADKSNIEIMGKNIKVRRKHDISVKILRILERVNNITILTNDDSTTSNS